MFMVTIPALALKCYTCSGDCGSKNGDETTCPSGADLCMKVHSEADGKESTGRTCSNKLGCDLAKELCKKVKEAKKDAECDVGCCDTDLCNAGSAPSFSVVLITLCSLFSWMSFFK